MDHNYTYNHYGQLAPQVVPQQSYVQAVQYSHEPTQQYGQSYEHQAQQPQEYCIPPPAHLAYQQPPYLLDEYSNVASEGPIGWVPQEERYDTQPQQQQQTVIGNEAAYVYSNVDQQPHQPVAPAQINTSSSSLAGWAYPAHAQSQALAQQPDLDAQIYQMAGEAVDAYSQHQSAVQHPRSSDYTSTQPLYAPAPNPTAIHHPAAASVPALRAAEQVYPGVQGYAGTQPATSHAQVASVPVSSAAPAKIQCGVRGSQTGYASQPEYANPTTTTSVSPSTSASTSSYSAEGAAGHGSGYTVAHPSSPQASYPGYQQAACGSSQSMAILNGEVPHAQIQSPVYTTSPATYEQYPATHHYHHQEAFVIPPPQQASVVLQQPKPVRSSSLAGWADVPPTPVAKPAVAPVQQQQHLNHEPAPQYARPAVKLEQPAAMDVDAPPVPQMHPRASVQSKGKARATQAQPPPQAQPLSRSATLPEMTAATAQGSLPRSLTEFDVAPRPVEVIKASETVRQAAKLHVDVGLADPNSPTSHEARVKARSEKKKKAAASSSAGHGYHPYDREYAARRGSCGDRHCQQEHQPVVPSSKTEVDQYGANRTFIYNPYKDQNELEVDEKHGIPHGLPLPAPSGPVQHQTIGFSNETPEVVETIQSSEKTPAEVAIAAAVFGEKKPFLACGFCRQRKIACGLRAPHPLDHTLPEGPRTCNQCARRGILCAYPSESRRGLRKTKPVIKTIYNADGTTSTILLEDEDEIEEYLAQQEALNSPSGSKKRSYKSKRKATGPMEWIIAVDAYLITPAAWEKHLKELEEAEAKAAALGASLAMPVPEGITSLPDVPIPQPSAASSSKASSSKAAPYPGGPLSKMASSSKAGPSSKAKAVKV